MAGGLPVSLADVLWAGAALLAFAVLTAVADWLRGGP